MKDFWKSVKSALPAVLAVFAVTADGIGAGVGTFYAAAWLAAVLLLGVG